MRSLLTVAALAASLPAQWDPISPGPFAIGPHRFGLNMGPGWWGSLSGGDLALMHFGYSSTLFTDYADWRMELHISRVFAQVPPCGQGGRFLVCRDYCQSPFFHPLATSSRDPAQVGGSAVDAWVGSWWGGIEELQLDGMLACPYGERDRCIFMLVVDDLRIHPH